MTVDLPTTLIAGPILVLLFAYAWRLIRRSDAERDRYVRRIEWDRDFWRARALGLEPPDPIDPEHVPDPGGIEP